MAPVPIPAASVCFRCQNPGSSPERFMLQCCECKRTWHHTCHAPPVPEKDLIEGIRAFNDNHVENIFTMWTCKRCGKKPKASGSRATSSAVDERRVTANAPARPPAGAPIVAPRKNATSVPPVVAPKSKHSESGAPPPPDWDALRKPAAGAQAGALRAPSTQRQSGHSALSVSISTPQPPRGRTSQDNPYAGRLADTLEDTTCKKSSLSKRSAKAPVPATFATASTLAPTINLAPPIASSGPSTTSWRPNAPLLQSTASFASSASLASAASSRATSLSSIANTRPRSADGTVIDLGDRLEEMNVDTPDAGYTPHSASPVPPAAHTGVGLDDITAFLLARSTPPLRELRAAKPPVPGVSLPYEWLRQKELEAEAKRPGPQAVAHQRRSRKAVATKRRGSQPGILLVGGAVVSV
ncbi:uncharacterized protein SCHCODRAFT_02615310 [Schizophyllum commune H4-8]|nr:uncharacterized protein SCHCODRAFT_02615310 [Schizophyllum commune H4-8]KAI5896600.1 hypothetical protein SCHCODRAFT_02615310 [Schizophyllum commune H4-8]